MCVQCWCRSDSTKSSLRDSERAKKRVVDNVWARNCNYSIHFPISHEVCAPIGHLNVMIENYWKNCVTIIFHNDNFMNFNFFRLMIFFATALCASFVQVFFHVAIENALFTNYVIFFVRLSNFSCSISFVINFHTRWHCLIWV